MPHVRVWFSVEGCPPEDVTALLQMKPDRARKIGDNVHADRISNEKVAYSPLPAKSHLWKLEAESWGDTANAEDLLYQFLERLEPHRESIKALSEKGHVGFIIIANSIDLIENESFGFHIERNWIERIAALGASIDVTVSIGG